MLNKLWPIFIVISFIFSILNGSIENLNNSIFNSLDDALTLTLTLLGSICFWNGIMNIASHTSIISKIQKILNPILKKIFPQIDKNEIVHKQISMNIIANLLGLGNAATPLGLQAMNSLQKKNKKRNILSNDMMMLIVINTASLQIIPTTVIAIRTSLNSENATGIIFPVWICTIICAITTICATKILIKRRKYD